MGLLGRIDGGVMSNQLPRIMAEVTNRPLLCTPDYAEAVFTVLSSRSGLTSGTPAGDFKAREAETSAPAGVAVIPIIGSLTHRAGNLDAQSGMRSYQSISQDLDAALADTSIKRIVLEIDSPGGAVMGAFDLADKIYAARGQKEIIALVDGLACSAGYLLASQAGKIYATQTSMTGSIGVVMMHLDRSKQLQKEGIKPTFIFRGDRKIDGSQALPLSGDAKRDLQASIDEAYDMFVSAVSRGRGLSHKAIQDTQAGVFGVNKALEVRLIDGISTRNQVINGAFGDAPLALSSATRMSVNYKNLPAMFSADTDPDTAPKVTSKPDAIEKAELAPERTVMSAGEMARSLRRARFGV